TCPWTSPTIATRNDFWFGEAADAVAAGSVIATATSAMKHTNLPMIVSWDFARRTVYALGGDTGWADHFAEVTNMADDHENRHSRYNTVAMANTLSQAARKASDCFTA